MRRGQADYLFHEGDWFATSEQWRQKLRHEIESQNGDELLNTSTVDLAAYYAGKFTLNVPTLHEDEIVVDKKETQIDVSHDRDRYFSDRSGPHYITGTEIIVEVPFTGDEVGFRIQPTTQNFNNPTAKISGQKIFFSIAGTNLTSEKVNSEIKGKLTSINQHLEWLRKDASAFNASLSQIATDSIEHRKAKLLKDKNLLAGLDFKMKERPGEKQTYATPNVRRTIRPEVPKPAASRQPFKPEPVIADTDYEHILKVLENMVKVMEQSPGAFQKIDEESLRTHFLVQLNGHFDGNATGETFNYEGKTDILIKVDGRNVFVGECKFWTGEKAYIETLDQVLSYLSWRDTKASVLMFSRNRDFSAVISKIAEVTPQHPNHKRVIAKRSETSWTYLFGHKDDPNREILITVQAYNVPSHIEPRIRTV